MRRIIRNTLLTLLALIILALAGGYLYLRQSLPKTSGTLSIAGLEGAVEIVRDGEGVPHIFASTDHDAFLALGYVHAQDRMWQLEMNRRIGNGRLSEVLGSAALDIDKFQRTMGYARIVRKGFELIDERSKQGLQAYADGINAWIGEGHVLPLEFLILGVEPEPWTVYDSLVWAKMMAWDLGSDFDLELLRAKLANALGPERAAQIMPGYPPDAVTILRADFGVQSLQSSSNLPAQFATRNLPRAILDISDQLETYFTHGGREVGSNDWVIGGSRTESGKPILADDPHLGASIPAVWYLAELQGATIHAIGATFPGLPAIVIGHNERIAWGVTNLNPDVQDLYVEKINPANPNQYEVNGKWQNMQIVEEEIKVSGEAQPIRWAARSTRHGPLISDVSSDASTPVALRWTALDTDDTTIDAFVGINYATNWEDFREAMRVFVGPSQNFVYADIEGNIGYFGPGRIPIRKSGEGYLPMPGWNDDAEWTGWIPFDELPQAFNPEPDFVATANNKVVPDDYPYFISNDWAEPFRAERISELIEQMSSGGEKISLEDVAAIHGDQSSSEVKRMLPILSKLTVETDRQKQALDLVTQWNGTSSLDSVASTIYEAWMMHLTRAIFEDDLRGELYKEMSNRGNPVFLYNVLNDPAAATVWCDNLLTAPKESCAEIVRLGLDSALDDLTERMGSDMKQWQWQNVHITQYPHRPFSDVAALKWLFHRTIANGGNRYTVNVSPSRWNEPYNQYHVPSYRQIVDMSDLSNSRFILTTGQSGNVLSAHYDDFIERHRDVKYLAMSFGREQVNGDVLRLERSKE